MRAMSPVDHAWYRMDSPENLMMVHAIMWTDEPLDWDAVRSGVAQGMLDRFPKFREHPVAAGLPLGRAGWEVDADFDLDRHVVLHTLSAPGDRRALEDYIATQVPQPLDPSHPMWQVHCIDGYGGGSAVLFRMHHSIADGITLTRVLLSLTSSDDTHAGFVAPHPATGPVGLAMDLSRSAVAEGWRALRDPLRVVGATTATVKGARRLLHLATIPQKPRSALAGRVGRDKSVRWTDPWPVADIKAVGRAAGVTINDVLLSILADALSRYLAEEGTPLESVRVMVPVNLRPLDQPLTADLGNVFGEYIVTLPTGPMAPDERLTRMRDIIAELKGSPEAVVAYLTLVAIGMLPGPVEDLSTRVFSGKVVATVSNVPGPRSTVHLAGTPVAGIIGWVPGASDVGLGVSMFSYDGGVRIGLLTDTSLIPDPDRLCTHLESSLLELRESPR
jgi:diacylglycerol O-acyltransferase